MQVYPAFAIISLTIGVISCSPSRAQQPTAQTNPPTSIATPSAIKLSTSQKSAIGRKIWQNESAGKVTGLTHWNDGEEFPSMGIGHFIWYPKGFNGRWTETFPEFVRYATSRGNKLPAVAYSPDCPWPNKVSFQRDFNGSQLTSLRNWLASNINIQTEFIAYKSRAALPKIMSAAPATQRSRIQVNYNKVATTPNGVYALVDYVNFKGDGTNPREQYKGQGWGLMWVLMEMHDVPSGQAAAAEFAESAKRCLDRRVRNSPAARGEKRWTPGWHNRCNTYARPF